MRPISVLNVEGRIFFSAVHKRVANFLIKNGYISTKMQKAFIEGIAGCIEHGILIQEAIRYAREHRKSICITWLDLANAFGCVPHMLVQFCLRWYNLPAFISRLFFNYYEGVFSYIDGPNWSSEWYWIAIDVPQGCTASTIIFNMTFQIILDIHKVRAGHLKFDMPKAGISIFRPAYADDVGLATDSPAHGQESLGHFRWALDWSRAFRLRVVKCRSYAAMPFPTSRREFIKHQPSKSYSSFDPKLTMDGLLILFIGYDIKNDRMFKYVGHYIQDDNKTDRISAMVDKKLQDWQSKIDETLLTGPMKSWCLNFGVGRQIA